MDDDALLEQFKDEVYEQLQKEAGELPPLYRGFDDYLQMKLTNTYTEILNEWLVWKAEQEVDTFHASLADY